MAIADIQQEEKSYIDAEEDAISAIKILNKLPKTEVALDLYWNLYNLLAIISESTLDEKKTIEYYNKSIEYSKQMNDGFGYEIYSINNKASALRSFGKYSEALELFYSLLKERVKYEEEEPDFYPTILINIAKTKFESGDYTYNEVENYLNEAYKIC